MNNNIKETTSLVFVKGKNLFNKNNVLNGYRFGSDGALYAESGFFATDFIEVNSNTQYTVSWAIQTTQCVCYYDENKNFISRNSSNQTFITPANCKYIRASVFNGVINSAQIEQGSQATTYQEYVENQIYIKNKNDVFEEFLGENAIIPFNLSVNYTSDVQNCFAVDNIVNINLNTFNSNGFTRDAWTIIATIPAGFRPSKVVYMSAYGSDGGWNSSVAVPVMINTSGEILVFLKTTVKRILISSSYLQ